MNASVVSAEHPTPRPTGPNERLSATFMLSAALFGVVILGIGFSQENAAPVVPTLDVILTPTRSDTAPLDADFIAQANNQGGGDQDHAQRPRDNQIALTPQSEPGLAPIIEVVQAPPPEPKTEARVLNTSADNQRVVALPEDRPLADVHDLPTGRELVEQSLEIARQTAEVDRISKLYAKRPRRKQITASTQEYVYAGYMRGWIAKVERVGNLNYPDEARRRGLSGRLVMTVAVRRDGSVEDATLVDPSGKALLDAAALRIVRLAEPFPPLPETDEHIDILHITRTWEFSQGSVSTD